MYQIITFIGFPAIISCICFLVKQGKKIEILMKSQQAQMRNTLIHLYHKHMEDGYITDDDMDNWENQYQAYHSLGKNGVMDTRREELLRLPSKKN